MGRVKVNLEEEKQILKYAQEGMYLEDISYILSLPVTRINNCLKRNNTKCISRPISKKMSFADRQKMEKHTRAGKSIEEIAYLMQISRSTVYREIERGGAVGNSSAYSAEIAQRKLFG